MIVTLYVSDEDAQALHDMCVACMGRGCTSCLPAGWNRAVWESGLVADHAPTEQHITTAPNPDRERETAEVLRILTAARKDPPR